MNHIAFKKKLDKVKSTLDLTALQLARIFHVDLNDVIDWLEPKNQRIDCYYLEKISEILSVLRNHTIDLRLGSYMYRMKNDNGNSLFDMLCEPGINIKKTKKFMSKVAQAKKLKMIKRKEHEKQLEEQGFKMLTTEELKQKLDEVDLSF